MLGASLLVMTGKGDTSNGSVLFGFHILAIRSMPTDFICKISVAYVEYSY